MLAISSSRPARGFTLIEMMVVVAILGIVLAVGIPKMTNWVATNKAASASEFYLEGFRLARQEALGHNAASRIVLTTNASTGQYDWQVDICFPTAAVPCSDTSGTWSDTATAASGDPEGTDGFKSVARPAVSLPPTSVVAPTLLPANSFSIYYTSLGWVDTGFAGRMSRIQLDPGPGYTNDLPSMAVVVTLAGMASKCYPNVDSSDARACPP